MYKRKCTREIIASEAAEARNVTKLWIKTPDSSEKPVTRPGYINEATIHTE
ncbi:MAG: hypothetical protein LBV08_06570 [Clostridiales bacterium]|nr:hypothetical protein [Clostridiales bacterium]